MHINTATCTCVAWLRSTSSTAPFSSSPKRSLLLSAAGLGRLGPRTAVVTTPRFSRCSCAACAHACVCVHVKVHVHVHVRVRVRLH
jgi:hypothetical protein